MFPPSWNNYLLFSSKPLCDLTLAYVLILFLKPVLLNSLHIYQLKVYLSFEKYYRMQPLRWPQIILPLGFLPVLFPTLWAWPGTNDSFLMNLGWNVITQRLWCRTCSFLLSLRVAGCHLGSYPMARHGSRWHGFEGGLQRKINEDLRPSVQ